ncbi:TOTE conflict system archaeo-eukaryotic primase domain-containing protein [Paraburkholderia azotifigens]|uniref:TOTE conflict system archaeo-eukaryotic primase domain-containing protein n=1 Tax=Paraburkholderia azotifigens TaxID=2057004 RepID=UPI0038B6B833
MHPSDAGSVTYVQLGRLYPSPPESSRHNPDEKVFLFRRLFQGRVDPYPIRWEIWVDKSGYSPVCANEWWPAVCENPRIKCSDCGNRLLIPLSDQIIYDHLAGRHTIGVYSLLTNDTCRFLAVDFDDADWREAAKAFRSRRRSVCRRYIERVCLLD